MWIAINLTKVTMTRRRPYLVYLLWLSVSLPVTDAPAQVSSPPDTSRPTLYSPAWRFRPSISFAYDSFGQRYEIADEDTVDLVDELSGRLVTSLEHTGTTKLKIRNSLGLGEEATRDDLLLSLQRRFGSLDLRFTDDMRYKAYRSDSEFTLSSDYLTNTSRVIASWSLPKRWHMRLDERFEFARVAERSRYNYDYHRNDLGTELERSYGIFSTVRAGYTFGTRSVPDSSAIDYQRHALTSQWTHEFGLSSLALTQYLERRLYGDSEVRSNYLDYEGMLSLSAALHPQLRLRPSYQASMLTYDDPDSVYANGIEQAAEILLELDFIDRVTLAVGPRLEFRRTKNALDRSYNQWGAKGSISYLAGSRFWVQFTNELGVRSHFAGDDVLYTDYFFNWTTLYLSLKLVSRATFDLFFSLNPETHEDARNNTTTMLLSTALTYGLH